jgi:methylmalonyl-CoA mutase N-terminal domain/subunit
VQVLRIEEAAGVAQRKKLQKLKAERSGEEVERRLGQVRRAAEGKENLMPVLMEAVRQYATLGEVCSALRDVFGQWEERPVI